MKRQFMPFKDLIPFYMGAEDSFVLEHRFFNVVSFFGAVIGTLTLIINLIVDASLPVMFLTAMVGLSCWIIFYLSRFRNKFALSKWLLSSLLYGLFTCLFIINNGSRGPVLYLYMVFFLLLIFVWNGKERLLHMFLFSLNIALLLLLELKVPHFILPYDTENNRLLDVFLSYIMYIVLIGVIMMFAKNSYIREKLKAERSDQLKSAFLANMSHEIRTPMNAILGFTQLLQSDLSKEKKEAYLKIINENSASLLRLIEDIIDVSKIEAGEVTIEERDVNIDKILSGLQSTFTEIMNEYPERKVVLIREGDTATTNIISDGNRIKQVMTNLLHNALKYTDEGEIVFGYEIQEHKIRFFVKDTGQGIKDENLKEIFDRFRKIESEHSLKVHPGTGIGLSISKNLVELLGGEIGVSSELGKGSEFFFIIPFKPGKQELSVRSEVIIDIKKSVPDLKAVKVLVAEDDQTNFHFLKKVLEKNGAIVMHAWDGKEALELCRKHEDIDIVLMDILMPEMNGYEASGLIKKERPGLPIIAQTALAMEGDAQKVLDAGCDDYVSKPIRIQELTQMLSGYFPLVKSSGDF